MMIQAVTQKHLLQYRQLIFFLPAYPTFFCLGCREEHLIFSLGHIIQLSAQALNNSPGKPSLE